MKWEKIDLSQCPSGVYHISENIKDNGCVEGGWVYPFKLFGHHCLKDYRNDDIWILNPKHFKWQLLVKGK